MTKPSKNLIEAIAVTAEIYGKEFSSSRTVEIFAADLSQFPEHAVIAALARCRRELRHFPSLADIIARIDDGRPGAEEAWAMIPKDERASIVWTDEMREAYNVVRGMIDEDAVAARMAFRETYVKLVSDARGLGTPANWTPSLGHDRSGRECAVREAIRKGRLSAEHGQKLLAESSPSTAPRLTGPSEPELTTVDPLEMLRKIRAQIESTPTPDIEPTRRSIRQLAGDVSRPAGRQPKELGKESA